MNNTMTTEQKVDSFARIAGRAIAKARREGASSEWLEAMHRRAAERVREIRSAR